HLYKGSREQATTRFTGWALDHARAMIHFDSALWAIGTPGERIHSAHYYQLPGTMLREWERRRKADSGLNPLVEGRLNNPVRLDSLISVAGTCNPPLDLSKLCSRFGIQHALCTAIGDTESKLHHFICFYRNGSGKPFSEEECSIKKSLAPHLVEARNNNIFLHFSANKESPFKSAVCDRYGMLHQMENGFLELLRAENPGWQPPYLPFDLDHASVEACDVVFDGATIVIKASPIGDLLHLQAREKSRSARLSSRERTITKHLISGMAYKEIANTLSISPSTVTKHVNSIYKKIGVKNKTSLAKAMDGIKAKA
ncbi:MAG: LuxR C-terminal-related transcriptional regulator, partial [Pseudomonadota bacterium]